MANFTHGTKTETAGTPIRVVIPHMAGRITRLTKVIYDNAATAHTLTVMRPIGNMQTTSPVLASGTAIPVSSVDPGETTAGVDEDLGSNDLILIMNENGAIEWHTISSVTAATINISGTLAADVLVGATVWALYEVGRATHQQIPMDASVKTDWDLQIQGGYSPQQGVQTSRSGVGDPLLVSIDNITNAGTLEYLQADHVDSPTF